MSDELNFAITILQLLNTEPFIHSDVIINIIILKEALKS